MNTEIDSKKKKLSEFTRLQQELAEKYQMHVQEDFLAQTDGLFDEISRNAALKVIHSKKRLQQATNETNASLIAVTMQFCGTCHSEFSSNAIRKHGFCAKCPERSECKKSRQ